MFVDLHENEKQIVLIIVHSQHSLWLKLLLFFHFQKNVDMLLFGHSKQCNNRNYIS